ncbi:MAG: M23 family metallopeptidase [Aquincola sp.]|nr:M23 family metallopeptidase [Aquincola sp.]
MQIMITHGSLAQTRVLQFTRLQLSVVLTALVLLLLLLSGLIYHFVFLTAARERWPVISQVVRLVVRDEIAQRDRFLRENIDVMATKVGEMQAKLLKLESMGDRVSSMAGVKAEEFKPLLGPARAASSAAVRGGGQGGPYVPGLSVNDRESLDALLSDMDGLDVRTDQTIDLFTLIESRLLEGRLTQLLVPSTAPVVGPVGSGFGFRIDPFTGHGALHMGLDFPADVGTPILAAAGGVVVSTQVHPAYGRLVEIDHGNGLVTRYAHTSKILVKNGDLVKRGQLVAQVGNTGRSTGPHLHFEVLVDGVPQNPARFLAGRGSAPGAQASAERTRRPRAAASAAADSGG